MKKIIAGMFVAIALVAPSLPTPAHAQVSETPVVSEAQIEVLKQQLISLLTQLIAELQEQLRVAIEAEVRANIKADMADNNDQVSGGSSEDNQGDGRDEIRKSKNFYPGASASVEDGKLVVSLTKLLTGDTKEVKAYRVVDGERSDDLIQVADAYDANCGTIVSGSDIESCGFYPAFEIGDATRIEVVVSVNGEEHTDFLQKNGDRWSGGNTLGSWK